MRGISTCPSSIHVSSFTCECRLSRSDCKSTYWRMYSISWLTGMTSKAVWVYIYFKISENFTKADSVLSDWVSTSPVKGIKRVEQEVRVNLRLVERQLRLVLLCFGFLPGKDLMEELEYQFDGEAESRHDEEEKPHHLRPQVSPGLQEEGIYIFRFRQIREMGQQKGDAY